LLTGKNIIVGVCGGIAAYKACDLVSKLVKQNAHVDIIMTENATEFVTPLTFEALAKTAVVTDMFDRNHAWEIEHVSFAKKADAFVIVPATANIIAKMAHGIADDMLSTTILATKKPVIVCPAMNTGMFTNTATQQNLKTIVERGAIIVDPDSGRLACGDVGSGRLADTQVILDTIIKTVFPKRDLEGKKVLVTAGGTIERLDAVRYIANDSSGKMGFALAKNAYERGAKVTLIAGRYTAELPKNIETISVTTTQDMYDKVFSNLDNSDIIVMAAAPCDFKPEKYSENKIKEKELTTKFLPNPDIAASVGKVKGNKFLTIFSAETQNLIENATAKLIKKNADLCVANDVTKAGAGFNTDTNIVTFITKNGTEQLPVMTKTMVAEKIFDKIVSEINR